MLKTSGRTESKIQPDEVEVGVGGSRAGREKSKLDRSKLHGGEFDSVELDGGEIEDDEFKEKV